LELSQDKTDLVTSDNEASQNLGKTTRWVAGYFPQDFCRLIEAFGFRLSRIRGSHHIFVHPDIQELVNVQQVGNKSKPYQIRQFLRLVEEYNLELQDESA
jgi:predicted RNA binding protein YcfA (HicA-like mRNA interferase family)